MKTYSVTTPETLRSLCIKHNWFTCGTNKQYEKLFRSNDNGISIDGIALIIWVCSDNEFTLSSILSELSKAREEYWNAYFGVELSGKNRKLKFHNRDGFTVTENYAAFLNRLCDPEDTTWTPDTLIRIEESTKDYLSIYRTLWEIKILYAEWIPYMKAYRLYYPDSPQDTVSYHKNLEIAESIYSDCRISEVDADTMHVELH